MKNNQDATVVAGDDLELAVTVTENGSPKDISGATATWALAEARGGAVVLSKDTSAGIAVTDAPAGELTIRLSSAETTGLAGSYYHECSLTDGAGNTVTVLSGALIMIEETH